MAGESADADEKAEDPKHDFSLNDCRTKRTVLATRNVTAEIKVKIDLQWYGMLLYDR
jgi:hypothetical protein